MFIITSIIDFLKLAHYCCSLHIFMLSNLS